MKHFKNVFVIFTLLFTVLFIACSDGNNSNGNGDEASGDTVVCTYYMKDDTSVYYVFYGDKTAEYHANGKIENSRSELIYSGDPLKAGTVSLKISLTGTELISFNVKESNGTLIPTVELVPGFPVEYTLTLDGDKDNEENNGTDNEKTDDTDDPVTPGDNDGTETPEEPSTDIDESPLMFMGFDNVVTIEKGTDITGITNTIYSLTSDTTLKFKGGINSITLTTIAAAISTNDSVKIALDFSEATGITEWTNKLAGQKTLYAISLPSTVTSVQDEAFKDCTNLKAITVPKTITEFPSVDSEIIVNYPGTLADWLNGTLVLPKESTLYLNGKELSDEVTIPASVTAIRSEAFKYCSKITNIIIPDGITSIDENAFAECGEITVTMLGSFSAIGAKSFAGCTINNVVIGKGVTYIPPEAFYGCTWLTNITIPKGVTEIGYNAFGGCTGLTNITLPDSIINIDNLFDDCTNLTSIYYDGTLETYITNNLGFRNNSSVNFYINNEKVTEITDVVIPDSVETIGSYAFWGWKNLTNVTIPDSVTIISQFAFHECTGLTNVTLPAHITEISFACFDHSGLTSITIPDGVTSIRYYAFENCSSLTSITIPNTVTNIESGAFYQCDNLTTINYRGSEKQWAAINIDSDNTPLTTATIVYNYTGD